MATQNVKKTKKLPVLSGDIRVMRCQRGLSQKQLADKAGVSRELIIDLESGKQLTAWRRTIRAIARALGVSIADLTGKKRTYKLKREKLQQQEEERKNHERQQRERQEADDELAPHFNEDWRYLW